MPVGGATDDFCCSIRHRAVRRIGLPAPETELLRNFTTFISIGRRDHRITRRQIVPAAVCIGRQPMRHEMALQSLIGAPVDEADDVLA